MAALDFEALKSYVRDGPTGSSALAAPNDGDTVSLLVTHSHLKRQFIDMKFSLNPYNPCFSLSEQSSVERVKEQLQVHTGTAVSAMQLQLFSASSKSSETDTLLHSGLEDIRLLGYYSPQNGYRLHVIDTDPTSAAASGWLDDTSLVEKYTISEEDYEKRDDSVRRFKQQLYTARPDLAPQPGTSADFMADIAATIKVGDRCEVDPGGKRGSVAFVGTVDVLPNGFWVGVKFDEPVGVNDGSILMQAA
ncbi:unnamed protein product [Closterium sp. Naga37s-1]|nr:unnamed protein product [Closterium sp. Naga37s-1]